MRAIIVSLLTVVMCIAGLLNSVQLAGANNQSKCESESDAKIPVLLVHGLNSSQGTWQKGNPSMLKSLEKIPDIALERFDYESVHNQWIDNPLIGDALARRIHCLAETSVNGKVIIVAHSMGGLATRYAAAKTIDGQKISDEIGLVITLGTPHLGSGYGNTCAITVSIPGECKGTAPKALAVGSKALSALPEFPADIPVRAIAGHVIVSVPLIYTTIKHDMRGDKVVGVDSAINEYTNTGKGDGVRVYKCFGTSTIPGNDASCEHTQMLKAAYIQEGVVQGVREYLDSLEQPSGRGKTLFNKLTVTYPDTWGGAMNNPGVVENIVDYTHCEDIAAVCPHIYFINLDSAGGRAQYGDDPVASAAEQASTMGFPSGYVATGPAELKGTVNVGGETAEYYEQIATTTHAPPQTRFYYWYIESRQLLITAYDSDYGPYSAETLSAVLEHAEWK